MTQYFLSLLFVLLLSFNGRAQDFPEPMYPRRIVNDFTAMFTPEQRSALETKLRHFNDTSSTQIAIVTVPDIHGYAPGDYAQRLAEKWGIGQKGKDNGILVLVKPKTGREKGEVAIAVGYGLEGVVPDAVASRIIRNDIIPEFQKGRYYNGINNAVDKLIGLTTGEYKADKSDNDENWTWFIVPFIILFIILPLLGRKGGNQNRGGGNYTGSGNSGGPFIFWGGTGGGHHSSGGSFGGFGGFGGGSFGGGGASGSW